MPRPPNRTAALQQAPPAVERTAPVFCGSVSSCKAVVNERRLLAESSSTSVVRGSHLRQSRPRRHRAYCGYSCRRDARLKRL